jgi:DNA-binding HxlR family transcriptional regulator
LQPVFEGEDVVDIELRSGCPINLTMEVLGDRWSLIIIRDIILAARLKRLLSLGFISKQDDPRHSQKAIYSRYVH